MYSLLRPAEAFLQFKGWLIFCAIFIAKLTLLSQIMHIVPVQFGA